MPYDRVTKRLKWSQMLTKYVLVVIGDEECWLTMGETGEELQLFVDKDPEYVKIQVWEYNRREYGDVLISREDWKPCLKQP